MGICASDQQSAEYGFVPIGVSQVSGTWSGTRLVRYFGWRDEDVEVVSKELTPHAHHHTVDDIIQAKDWSFKERFGMNPFGVSQSTSGHVLVYGLDSNDYIKSVPESEILALNWIPQVGDKVSFRDDQKWRHGKLARIPILYRNKSGDFRAFDELAAQAEESSPYNSPRKGNQRVDELQVDSTSVLGFSMNKVIEHVDGVDLSEVEKRRNQWAVECQDVLHYLSDDQISPYMPGHTPDATIVEEGAVVVEHHGGVHNGHDWIHKAGADKYGFIPFGACQRRTDFIHFYGIQNGKIVRYETEHATILKLQSITKKGNYEPEQGAKQELTFMQEYGFMPFAVTQTSDDFVRFYGFKDDQIVYVEEKWQKYVKN